MKKKAVIWVSTVLYILITIAVLGIALAALKPEIDKMRDKAIIEQSIEMMNEIDNTIIQVDENIGTRRQIQIQLKKGKLTFFCPSNEIIWQFNTTYKYSEPEEEINIGNVKVLTLPRSQIQESGFWHITLMLDYEDRIDIRFNEEEIRKKTFTAAELPYIFFIENKGDYIDIFPLSS